MALMLGVNERYKCKLKTIASITYAEWTPHELFVAQIFLE